MNKKTPVGKRNLLSRTFGGLIINSVMMILAAYGGLLLAVYSIGFIGPLLDQVNHIQFPLAFWVVTGLVSLVGAFWIYCLLRFLWLWLVLKKYRLAVGKAKRFRA